MNGCHCEHFRQTHQLDEMFSRSQVQLDTDGAADRRGLSFLSIYPHANIGCLRVLFYSGIEENFRLGSGHPHSKTAAAPLQPQAAVLHYGAPENRCRLRRGGLHQGEGGECFRRAGRHGTGSRCGAG